MDLIPPFTIGISNLWICTLLLWVLPISANLVSGSRSKRFMKLPGLSPGEKAICSIWLGLQVVLYVYSIFVPFVLNSIWFYSGLFIYVLGIIMILRGNHDYRTTPQDNLITKGIYQISRNVDYFSSFLAYIGMGLMGLSWPILLLAIAHFLLYQITVKYEERMCAGRWPKEFLEYKNKVAKNFLFF